MTASAAPRVPHAVGMYLAAVQFFFALGWVVYAAYLPQLAQLAGIDKRWVPWILVADQLVFVATDLLVGLFSDRAARVLGRIGRWVLGATVVSAFAFVLLPLLAPQGSPALFIAVGLVWVVTTSALRAPPLTLLGRYAAKPAQPVLIALASLGLGIANAAAPYVALQLKAVDPRWPFLLSGLALAVVTLGMVAAERHLARGSGGAAQAGTAAEPSRFSAGQAAAFVLACIVGAAAFQWHTFVASAPLALRHASAADLPSLLPVFWVGFNLWLVPAGLMCKRLGAPGVMVIGAEVAMVGSAAAAFAPTLPLLLGAQLIAGAGWAMLLCAAFSAALVFGHTGREGLMSGTLSSTLALAAALRIGSVAAVTPVPAAVVSMAWLPAVGFLVCAGLLMAGALRR